MRDEANKVDIATESFAYGSMATDEELSLLMASLQCSSIRHVYAICFEEQLVPILHAAVKADAIGSDFLYIFPSLDKSSLEEVLHIQHG
jgi:hypothetical protein